MDYRQYWKTVVQPGKHCTAEVSTFDVSKDESMLTSLRGGYVPEGTYSKLSINGRLVMSDTPKEMCDHREFFWKANGNVLINGLGLGCCLNVILHQPKVSAVTVVEANEDVIALVAPYFPHANVIHADALDWVPPRGTQYDAVWHDIWNDICEDNLSEMHKLHRRYGRRSGWQGSWSRGEVEYHRRRNRNRYRVPSYPGQE